MAALSIIVVSWNAKRYVQECLTSLVTQRLTVPLEIILVDNASSDGTPETVREQFPRVTLIQNRENLGFAKANNIGLRAAKGKYVSLINSDVNVPPECLQIIYDFMEHNPGVGAVGPQMLTPGGNASRSCMRFPTVWNCLCTALSLGSLFRRSRFFGGVLMTDFDCETTSDVDVLNGWFLLVRRCVLDQVGLLDENFFMYGEDIDWSYRFYKAGWRRVYLSKARALHYGGASSSSAATRFYIQMHRANLQYWKKHHGRAGVLAYWFTAFLHQCIRLGGHSIACLCKRESRAETAFKVKRSAACVAWLMGLRSRET